MLCIFIKNMSWDGGGRDRNGGWAWEEEGLGGGRIEGESTGRDNSNQGVLVG